jgi:predicted phosphodiesterase
MTDGARAQAEREIAAVNAAMMEGCGLGFCSTKPSAIRVAARQLGVDRNGFRERVGTPDIPGRHFQRFGLMPDWSLAAKAGTVVTPEPIIVPEAPRWTAPKMSEWRKPGEALKARANTDDVLTVLAIGDAHDKPGLSKDRFTWMGRLAADRRPDAIVSIGDWADLGSLSMHEPPGSARQAAMTTFAQDEESLYESLEAFHKDLGIGSIPTWITLGNHENRAHRAANLDPRRCSDIPDRVEQAYARHRWQSVEFGKFLTLSGCSFVHVPLNIMGREMGGMHLERSVANHATGSVVMGHTHRRGMFSASKVGENKQITCLNLGTAMPMGHIANYARLSVTGWSYGVYILRIAKGVILSEKFWDMSELEETYG